jgi:hypothetical protein
MYGIIFTITPFNLSILPDLDKRILQRKEFLKSLKGIKKQ